MFYSSIFHIFVLETIFIVINDFIFAVLAEELGYIGCLMVIILFAIFIWRGILISMKARDTFGSLIAIGITTLIGIQALINIAVVTGTMPVTGMELPFFSYGGTALFINYYEHRTEKTFT